MVAGALVAAGLTVAPASAVDAIAGPLTSGDSLFPNQGNGGYDVSHYEVDIAWTPAVPLNQSTIDATTTIQATATGDPLSSFGLDLEGLTVTSVTVDDSPAGFFRLDEPEGTEPPPKHKLVVTPASPVTGAFTVVVDYEGIPTTHFDIDGSIGGWIKTSDGATFLGQPTGSMTGFPNNNTPKDKATYTFKVSVPELPDPLEVASNGELASNTTDGTRRTWVWDQDRPMASELSLISIGQYDVLESEVSLSGGRTVDEWSFVDSALSQSTKDAIDGKRDQLSAVLTGLEGLFGPYPGNSTGVLVDNLSTGYALETQDRPFFPGSIGQNTFVHELAHQWYGDAVSPTVWNDLWINEGMATWAPVDQSGFSTYDEFHGEWQSISATSGVWKVPPVGITNTADLYGFQSYDRGAMTYEALRTLIGDAHFLTFIEQWQQRYDGESHGTADLVALAEEVSGQDLTAFFQDWLCDADKPAWPPAAPTTSAATCALLGDPPPTNPPPTTTPGTIGPGCGATVQGKARVGRKLRSRIQGCPVQSVVTGYQWFAGGKRIKGADKATYRVKRSKLGKRLRVRVTVSAPGYVPAQRVSPPTKRVR